MKIIQINTIFPKGSTGALVKSLHYSALEAGYESIVLFGHGYPIDKGQRKICSELYMKYQAFLSRVNGLMYDGCWFSTQKVISVIKKEQPDIVHIHCINGHIVNISKLISWLKCNGIKTVLTNHAEIMYTANCMHAVECEKYQTGCGNCPRFKQETHSWFIDKTHKSWLKMKTAFDGFDSLIVANVSPWVTDRASHSTILGGFPHRTVLNGVDTAVFHYKQGQAADRNKKIILHVTASFSDSDTDLKGGKYVIELAKRFAGKNVKFLVAGKYSPGLVTPSNIILLGEIKDQDKLAELYSQADLVVLTSKRETFSMVVAESLCCGTPVVGFTAGAPEMIAIPQYSRFVGYGDLDGLYEAAEGFLTQTFDKSDITQAAIVKYSQDRMTAEYLKIYMELLQDTDQV